ncbi:MAG: DnaJ domain-containing protein [Candidatus Adiutrix sp.]|jgi:DnaJ-class molecular chaperone|nr:DnaJ domain-containing protein [Candidatus Adiutrix sp.]
MSLDPYTVLGVAKSADGAAIKSAYRKLARKYHPDVNPGDKAAEDKFKEISEAYDILSDPAKKQEYDSLGREGFYERGFGGAGYQRPDFNQSEFSFDSIFGDLFGGGGGRRSARGAGGFPGNIRFGGAAGPRKGDDVNLKLAISLREAALGTEARLELGIPQTCPQCQGQGVLSAGGGIRACPNCAGRGQVNHLENLKVQIPAGIKDGQKVRLKTKGSPGDNGGPAGDLLVEVAINPDPVFTRKERDLYADLPVGLYDLLLGGEVEAPTLTGRAQLKVPAGTQNGTRMRLKGQGLPAVKKEPAGDLYVTIKAVLPGKLGPEAKKLAMQLAEAAPPAMAEK